ncbi:MAG: gluconate permease [Actinomycetaceae bacterium]|jgi:Gnt-I system high-affinity gluconate transporter|nr:gluconate permease [Actinomycetaceae bacterium]
MELVILAAGVALLIALMVWAKMNAFISLITVAILMGLALGMPVIESGETPGIIETLISGASSQAGRLILLLGSGSMFGQLLTEFGVANKVANTLVRVFGVSRSQLAVVVISFLIGVTLFWETAWVILIPIVFAIVRSTKQPLLWLAMPLAIALSAMHSFLPPHPGPSAVAVMFHASIGKTLLLGLIVALPIGTAMALIWPRLPFVRSIQTEIPEGLAPEKQYEEKNLPSFGMSLFMAALPVLLIATATILEIVFGTDSHWERAVAFIGDANIALLIGVLVVSLYFRVVKHIPMDELMKACADGVRAIGGIIMILPAGGSLAAILQEGGVSSYLSDTTATWNLSPIFLGWLVAALMRIALGSASVAVVAAGGIVAPMVTAGSVSPEIMTLAVACGSVMASHVNDGGFWMFKEYLGLSVTQTLKVRTTYTSVMAVLGLGGCLLLNALL